jgi:hypothetical protein
MPSRSHRLAESKIVVYHLDAKCIYPRGAPPTKEMVDEQNSYRCSTYGNICERVGAGAKRNSGLNRSEPSPNAAGADTTPESTAAASNSARPAGSSLGAA